MRIGLIVLVGCTLASYGCAGFYLVGATMQKGAPEQTKASWNVGMCTTTEGQPLGSPGATYFLGDNVLYEMESAGSGARITNGWSDAQGQYFFTRVKTSHGWLYSLPNDKSQPAFRYVYAVGKYSVEEINGVIKPVGQPTAKCPLIPR